MLREIPYKATSGWVALVVSLALFFSGPAFVIRRAALGAEEGLWVLVGPVGIVLAVLIWVGLIAVQPNTARVLLLFGDYRGTVKTSGFYFVNPFYSKKKISLRIRNFETGSARVQEEKDSAGTVLKHGGRSSGRPSKVNDRDGNPVDISAVVVWRVVDTAEAIFEVDDYEDYVAIQSEAALRVLASRHPYDSEDHEVSLRGNTTEVSEQLKGDIQERLGRAGVEVIEARISYLAYAQEIAAAMLQRQQAAAVVAARTKIVEGAVGMVQMALDHLKRDQIVELDDERRAQMVSNLLVVLCSDRHVQPVVNTGSLY
ncbi:MAG: SPFH domain-containing protein [Gemmatimonadota bacterium]